MKPLQIALIVKNKPAAFRREDRGMGYFSYYVPEFSWDHITPGKAFKLDTKDLARRGYDLVIHEDGGAWGEYLGRALPVIYLAIDSTLSHEYHYLPRLNQARQADLILVDHDKLERFASTGKPVRRFSYCVNDKIFHPYGDKTADIAYHCNSGNAAPSVSRSDWRIFLHEFSQANSLIYRSGMLPLSQYAESLSRARLVVNWPRNPQNRPHRVLDTMASGSLLLTGPIPQVSEEGLTEGKDYFVFKDRLDFSHLAKLLLDNAEQREEIARGAYRFVTTNHTWAIRAQQLRHIIKQEFGI